MGRWYKGCSIPLPHIHQRLFPFNTVLQDGTKKPCCGTFKQTSTFEAIRKIVKLEALIAATSRFLLFREWRRTTWKIRTIISGEHYYLHNLVWITNQTTCQRALDNCDVLGGTSLTVLAECLIVELYQILATKNVTGIWSELFITGFGPVYF